MKPLLIIPPAPLHWPALRDLYSHEGEPWLADLNTRMNQGVPGASDACAVIPSGGQFLAGAIINKAGNVGTLSHGYTRPEHRRRGYARQLTETLLSWFDMTGGQRLHLTATAELDEAFYSKFGFSPLRRAVWAPYDRLSMLRIKPGTPEDPIRATAGNVSIRPLVRSDWPRMVDMLQYLPGPDPRVPLEESAVSARLFTLDLINHLEQRRSALLGAFRGNQLVGVATVAIDQPHERTYAMLLPQSARPPSCERLCWHSPTSTVSSR